MTAGQTQEQEVWPATGPLAFTEPYEADECPLIYQRAVKWSEFKALVDEWKSERGARPTAAAMAALPAYLKIIGMGDDALPFILAELKAEGDSPSHWFLALAAIARNVNPVPEKSRGKLREMAKAWLEWGEKEGHV